MYSYDRTAVAEISIGALERSVRTLAKKLERLGLRTEVDVFRTGRGGQQHYGASYVELTVKGDYTDEDGRAEEAWTDVTFVAGGYDTACSGGSCEIGGQIGWREMSRKGLDHIMRDLKQQGWREP